MAKWIEFKVIKELPKTKVYEVVNKENGSKLGRIGWYPSWRRYVFAPFQSTVFEQDCLRDIAEFLDICMAVRKK